MHIYQEYFKETREGIYMYTVKILNPASENTWHIQAVIHDENGDLKITDWEPRRLNEKPLSMVRLLEEKGILRDFVYDMVGQLSRKERSVMKEKTP